MTYTCRVCPHRLDRPPCDHVICPGCGTHYGYDDAWADDDPGIYAELRQEWIDGGGRWWSQTRPEPPGWRVLADLMVASGGR